jgi:hypothetical protein
MIRRTGPRDRMPIPGPGPRRSRVASGLRSSEADECEGLLGIAGVASQARDAMLEHNGLLKRVAATPTGVFAIVVHNAAAVCGAAADFITSTAHLRLVVPVSRVLDGIVTACTDKRCHRASPQQSDEVNGEQ